MSIEIIQADYGLHAHAEAVLYLLDTYARDPMGGGTPLKSETKANLIAELARRPFALSILAFVDGKPAGLINAIEGFSTFAAKPLLNLHDIAVHPDYRGMKLSTRMMEKAEQIARERGCCKLTLEVLSGNVPALAAYKNFGFTAYELDPAAGTARFLDKPLK